MYISHAYLSVPIDEEQSLGTTVQGCREDNAIRDPLRRDQRRSILHVEHKRISVLCNHVNQAEFGGALSI